MKLGKDRHFKYLPGWRREVGGGRREEGGGRREEEGGSKERGGMQEGGEDEEIVPWRSTLERFYFI